MLLDLAILAFYSLVLNICLSITDAKIPVLLIYFVAKDFYAWG